VTSSITRSSPSSGFKQLVERNSNIQAGSKRQQSESDSGTRQRPKQATKKIVRSRLEKDTDKVVKPQQGTDKLFFSLHDHVDAGANALINEFERKKLRHVQEVQNGLLERVGLR
jgi:hypothetical protein